MSNFLDNLLSSNGCTVDGTISNNPINRIVDTLFNNLESIADNSFEALNTSNSTYYNNGVKNEYSNDIVQYNLPESQQVIESLPNLLQIFILPVR